MQLTIEGGCPLVGSVPISGAKNAVLPLMAASLLFDAPLILHRVPQLHDVQTMCQLLMSMGVRCEPCGDAAWLFDSRVLSHPVAPYETVSKMRASILVLGPLLARFGRAKVALPGGCEIGSRPIDAHIEGLRAMGAEVIVEEGYIVATTTRRLRGANIVFDKVMVTATENLLMAATLADGVTTLHNAAMEPEVVDLVHCLRSAGARIEGEGTTTLRIEGVTSLRGTIHTVIPDRIEAATYLIAGLITGGAVTVTDVVPAHLQAVLERLADTGAKMTVGETWIRADSQGQRPRAVNVITAPYPAFPTDVQAQFMALNTIAMGHASIIETVFENRFRHASELSRMGAHIKIHGQTAEINGVPVLTGAPLKATDLRASAGLVLAGLAAHGTTHVTHVHHIDRGYVSIEKKLQALGARIHRVVEESLHVVA